MAPTLRRRREPVVLDISSSSTADEDEEGSSDEDVESEEGSSSSVYEDDEDEEDVDDEDDDSVDDDGEEEEEDEDEDGKNERRDHRISTEKEVCEKISDLLRRGKNLGKLRLEDCRAFLRKHNLRVGGKKEACIQRIHEYWRIKDGNAESLYPVSSFNINCTGDVCKGDVILFKQRVYEKFDIVTRGANIIGKRTIAGRVVKESYGAAKQQHTFTVEVLWSKGVKRLPSLFCLLVKGRNLYRLRTFRQRWKNEAERSSVLSEKHKRGAAARHARAIFKARSTNKGSKRKTSSSSASTANGTRKVRRTNRDRAGNTSNQQSKPRIAYPSRAYENPPSADPPRPRGKHALDQDHYSRTARVHELGGSSNVGFFHDQGSVPHYSYPETKAQLLNYPSVGYNHSEAFHPFSNQSYPVAFNRSNFRQQFDPPRSTYNPNTFDLGHCSAAASVARWTGRQQGLVHACPSLGCWELAAHGCVAASCYSCCRRIGRRCHIHQN